MSGGEGCQDTIAFVLIKTELGQAGRVAKEVSRRNWEDETDNGTIVRGVRWAIEVTGPYDVVAAVRVKDNEALGEFVVNEIQAVEGVRNPLTLVMTRGYKNGEQEAPHGGFP
jgi:DNA-binding Lrp family transcriptional regulator